MKQIKLRVAVILAALLLIMSNLPAIAAPTIPDILESGKNLQMDIMAELNPMLGSLMVGFNHENPEATDKEAIDALLSAINKLNSSMLINRNGASGTVGTESGVLLNFQASYSTGTGENHTTSSLLPGLDISLDPVLIAELTARTTQLHVTPEQLQHIVASYMKVLAEEIEELQQTLTYEEGRFVVEGYGTFIKRTLMTLTSHRIADLLKKLADVFKSDESIKEYGNEAVTPEQSSKRGISILKDFFRSIEKTSEELKSQEDKPLLAVWAYENADSLYLDGVTSEDTEHPVKFDLMIKGRMNSANRAQTYVNLKIIGKGMSRKTEYSIENRVIDWAAIQQEILSGSNDTDALLTLGMNSTSELPKVNTTMTFAVISSGMNVGFDIKKESNKATMESSTVASVSYLKMDPLLKITIKSKPTDTAPLLPVLDGTIPIVVKRSGMNEQESSAFQGSLTKGGIGLLVRMGIALPDDALEIIKLAEEMVPFFIRLVSDQEPHSPSLEQPPSQDLAPQPGKEERPLQLDEQLVPVNP